MFYLKFINYYIFNIQYIAILTFIHLSVRFVFIFFKDFWLSVSSKLQLLDGKKVLLLFCLDWTLQLGTLHCSVSYLAIKWCTRYAEKNKKISKILIPDKLTEQALVQCIFIVLLALLKGFKHQPAFVLHLRNQLNHIFKLQ